ncbi:MAG: hypothetical protein AAFN74_22245 [Myxococcota bacterium]
MNINILNFLGRGLAVGLMASIGCVESSPPAAESDVVEEQAQKITPFRHELASVAPVNGLYPIVDIQDSPNGQRYSMETRIIQACPDCPIETTTGVFERQVERRSMNAASRPAVTPTPVTDPGVELAWYRAPQASLELELIYKTKALNVTRALERQIATGEVTTSEEIRAARTKIVARRNDELSVFINDKIAEAEAMGITVVESLPALGRLRVRADRQQLERISPDLRRAALAHPDVGSIDGADMVFLREGHQLNQFISNGFDGERNGGSSDDFRIAFWEGGLDIPANLAMFNDVLSSDNRVSTWCPSGAVCSVVNSATRHPNRVLSVGIGDLADGQDSAVSGTTNRINKSGVAVEARATQYVGGWIGAANQMLLDAGDFEVAVVNAAANATGSPTCQGNSSSAIAADALFEAGVFVVGGAGNDGDSTVCNVKQPKDAIGVFTTAGTLETANSAIGVREGTLHPSSSVGGVKGAFSNSGRGRTIIDMAFNFGFLDRPNWDGSTYGWSTNGNSLTGPAVAGAAVNYSDWFETGHGSTSLIGNPGKLFATMLLMGDRTHENGKFLRGFGRRWGAGRLKMRKFDSAGLDAPAQWAMATVCVGDGESVYYNLTSNLASSTDYDIIKGVLFWYDNRLEDGVQINNLNLTLQRSVNGIFWTDYRSGTSANDNKERVFASDATDGEIGGSYWRWRIDGVDVDESAAGDPAGCVSSGEQRAHIAWLVEDSDRDDAGGPSATEIEPED